MADGKILYRRHMSIKSPIPLLPQYFAFIHTKANSPSYFSKGTLRSAENHCIFHYTLKGRGSCYNEFGKYDVLPGQGFLSIVHDPMSGYAYPDDGTEEWEFICFCFENGNAVEMAREMIRTHGTIYNLDRYNEALIEMENVAHQEERPPQAPFESARFFYQLYSDLIASALAGNKSYANMEFHHHIRSAQSIIREEIDRNPSVEEVAFRLGLSREHLSRMFKSETGKMLKDYIREERILRACRLLQNTDMPIHEIAERMSFSSNANFVRYFHSTMKITPSVFRREGGIPDFLTVAQTSN